MTEAAFLSPLCLWQLLRAEHTFVQINSLYSPLPRSVLESVGSGCIYPELCVRHYELLGFILPFSFYLQIYKDTETVKQ